MRLNAIIQARLGSERLPGKVLKYLGGITVLDHVVGRVRRAGVFDEIVVATTDRALDDPLAAAAETLGVRLVRGSESDVLARFIAAVDAVPAEAIARITADCPLIDPETLAMMAARFRAEGCDCLTNARLRTFPRGLDAEFLTVAALREAARMGGEPRHREHVTPWLYEHPERYRICDFTDGEDRSDWRWTLDAEEDLALLDKMVSAVPNPRTATYGDFVRLLAEHPDWPQINAHVEQKKVSQ